MRYKDVIKSWLNDQRTFQKFSTYTCYANICHNHVLPQLGDLDHGEITTDLVQKFALDLLDHGNKMTGGGLSQSFVKDILVVIKITLPQIGEIKLPYAAPKEIETFNQSEMLMLINAMQLQLTPRTLGVLLTIHTGIRIGELCALQWSDVDLTSRLLHISKTLIRTYTKDDGSTISITPPKSKASVRVIPLNSWICHLLSLQQKSDNCYIITGKYHYLEPGKYRLWYNDQLKKLGIPHRKFHCLRHTFATNCIACGCDYKSLSQLLGHADVSTTMNLYVHPQMELKRQCVEHLVDLYK